jgi:hypothetical protein
MSTLNGGPGIILDGLILNLDAANTKSYVSGSTTWTDISRTGNNSTLINGPSFNTGSGGSIGFDGVDDIVTTSSTISLSGSNTRTLECWIFLTANQSKNIMGFGDSANGQLFDTILWFTSGFQRVVGHYYGGGFDTISTLPARNTINLNAWNQVVHTYSGTVASLYTNGILSNSLTVNINTTNTVFNVGAGSFSGYNFFSGRISNAKVYNKALTAQEILQNYNATKGRFGL